MKNSKCPCGCKSKIRNETKIKNGKTCPISGNRNKPIVQEKSEACLCGVTLELGPQRSKHSSTYSDVNSEECPKSKPFELRRPKSKQSSTYSSDYSKPKSVSGQRSNFTGLRGSRKYFATRPNITVTASSCCGTQNKNCLKKLPGERCHIKLNGLDTPELAEEQTIDDTGDVEVKFNKRLNKFTSTDPSGYQEKCVQTSNHRIGDTKFFKPLKPSSWSSKKPPLCREPCSKQNGDSKNNLGFNNLNNTDLDDDDWHCESSNSPWQCSDETERTTVYRKSYPPLPCSAYCVNRVKGCKQSSGALSKFLHMY